MRKKYEVIWTETAENDLRDILEHISNDSLSAALEVLKKIKRAASNLYHLPKRGRIVPELQDQGILQYRELVVLSWRIIYKISEKKVLVLSVFDSRQNLEDVLLRRLIRGRK